jgi:hypothetical protein
MNSSNCVERMMIVTEEEEEGQGEEGGGGAHGSSVAVCVAEKQKVAETMMR